MDPALIDRTTQPILGINESEQPVRPMTISGIEQSIPAKILSTDLRGSGTRLVRLNPGWGSRLAGAFTADIEIFVLKGNIRIGSIDLADYDYAAIPGGRVVGGFRSEAGAVALLMTCGPVRYDTSTGGAPADLVIGRPGETSWQRETDGTQLFTRTVATSGIGQVWLGSTHQDVGNHVWHRHIHDEETFVLDGEVTYVDSVDETLVTTRGGVGSYFYRPAGSRHTTPALIGDETVLTFHRSLGRHHTELVELEESGTN